MISTLAGSALICHDRSRPGRTVVGHDSEDSVAVVVYREDGV